MRASQDVALAVAILLLLACCSEASPLTTTRSTSNDTEEGNDQHAVESATELQSSTSPPSSAGRHMWLKGHWTECNALCDGGEKHRPVICYSAAAETHIADEFCPSPKPRTLEHCAMMQCPALWKKGLWSACTASCGVGIQYRHVVCHLRHHHRADDDHRRHNRTIVKRDSELVNLTLCNPDTKPSKVQFCEGSANSCPPPKASADNRDSVVDATTQAPDSEQEEPQRRSVTELQLGNQDGHVVQRRSAPMEHKGELIFTFYGTEQEDGVWVMSPDPESTCSVTCGTGVQLHVPTCRISSSPGSSRFEDEHCDNDTRPEATNMTCTRAPCPVTLSYQWLRTDWKPCPKCGNDVTQSMGFICVRLVRVDGPHRNAGVSLAYTTRVERIEQDRKSMKRSACGRPPHHLTRPCSVKDCGLWDVGDWGECSSKCGDGTGFKRRTVKCFSRHVLRQPSNHCDVGIRPKEVQPCRPKRKCRFDWAWVTEHSPCSVSCGGGTLNVSVLCRSSTEHRKIVLPSFVCGEATRPVVRRAVESCNDDPCPTRRETEEWGQCSRSCGSGEQEYHRCVFYMNPETEERLTEPNCTLLETRTCNAFDCPYEILWSSWSNCSTKCGVGVKTRVATCERTVASGVSNVFAVSAGLPDACSDALEVAGQSRLPCFGTNCRQKWNVGPWSQCSTTCAEGSQRRNVSCVRMDTSSGSEREVITLDSHCPGPKPADVHACDQNHPCPRWQQDLSKWAECDASCNEQGTQTMMWYCVRGNPSRDIPIRHCADLAPHRTITRPCMGRPCPVDPHFVGSDPNKVEIVSGELHKTTTLECLAEGHPPPSVSWAWRDPNKQQQFETLKKLGVLRLWRRGQVLVISSLTRELEGRFTCTARNDYNQASTNKELVIEGEPRFEEDPAIAARGQTVVRLSRESFSFPCPAVGFPTPELQFYRGGILLSGAGANGLCAACTVDGQTLTIANLTNADSGDYHCTASNKYGVKESRTVTLQVHSRYYWSFREPHCSATCGKGWMMQSHVCLEEGTDLPGPDVMCPGDLPDLPRSSPCSLQTCPPPAQTLCAGSDCNRARLRWGPFSKCSVTCGQGWQTRDRICTNKRHNGTLFPMSVCNGNMSPEQQEEARENRVNRKRCHVPCTGVWHYTRGPCSQTCGEGRRQLNATCMRYTKGRVWKPTNNEAKCINKSGRKLSSEPCVQHPMNHSACVPSFWIRQQWSPCSNFVRRRGVFCHQAGRHVDDSVCTELKPIVRENCVYWKVGEWSRCRDCYKQRNVSCHDSTTHLHEVPSLCRILESEPDPIRQCDEHCPRSDRTGGGGRTPPRRRDGSGLPPCDKTGVFYCNIMTLRLCQNGHYEQICPCQCRRILWEEAGQQRQRAGQR